MNSITSAFYLTAAICIVAGFVISVVGWYAKGGKATALTAFGLGTIFLLIGIWLPVFME